MFVNIKYLGMCDILNIKTPDEMWDTITNIGNRVKEYLAKNGINEFTYGKVYCRIDIRNKFVRLEPNNTIGSVRSTVEAINVIYKEFEDGPTKSVRYRIKEQSLDGIAKVYSDVVLKAMSLREELSVS